MGMISITRTRFERFTKAVECAKLYVGRDGLMAQYVNTKCMEDELIDEFKNADLLFRYANISPDMHSPIDPESPMLDDVPHNWLDSFGLPLPLYVPYKFGSELTVDTQLENEDEQKSSGITGSGNGDGNVGNDDGEVSKVEADSECGDDRARGSREENVVSSTSDGIGSESPGVGDGGSVGSIDDVQQTDRESELRTAVSADQSDGSAVSEEPEPTSEEVDDAIEPSDEGTVETSDGDESGVRVEDTTVDDAEEPGSSDIESDETLLTPSDEPHILNAASVKQIDSSMQELHSTADFKALCEEYGLGQSGTKGALVKRINKYRSELEK